MPHKIKQFTVLYSVADPDLQIRRGGGWGWSSRPWDRGGGDSVWSTNRGGGVTSPGMKLRKQANEITKSASLFSFRRKHIIGNFTTIPTLLTHYPLTNRWMLLLLFCKYYHQLKVEGFTFVCLVVFKGPFGTFLWTYDVTIIILMWQMTK